MANTHMLTSAARARPPQVFRFLDLAYDVQHYIITYFIASPDLVPLTFVSHSLSALATPALLSSIRLLYGLKPPSWLHATRPPGAHTESLILAQSALAALLTAHPERARHIRALAWQVCGTSGPTFARLFPLLTNLTRVHLVNPHPTHIHDAHTAITLPPLFPNVQDVRITGTTSLAYAMPILQSAHRLRSLALDTIHPHAVALDLLAWLATADLPSLRTLSLRALAQTRQVQLWDIPREDELLRAWRTALLALPALEHVTLALCVEYPVMALDMDPASGPSAERLLSMLAPVFGGQLAELKSLRLDGMWVSEEDEERLRKVVPCVEIDPKLRCLPRFWQMEE